MMVKTYNLTVFFDGYRRHYHNITMTAVNRFVSYHKDTNPDYYGHAVGLA